MRKGVFLTLAATSALAFSLPACAAENVWSIDPAHSSVSFNVKHMMVSNVTGTFKNVSGSVVFDGKDLDKSSVDANIGAGSIDTQIQARDEHLRGKTVLDASTYPTISFKSKRIVPESGGHFAIEGVLTLHGISQDVTLEAQPLSRITKDGANILHTGTTATAQLNRRSFGVTVDKTLDHGGALVGENVKVNLNIALVKPAE